MSYAQGDVANLVTPIDGPLGPQVVRQFTEETVGTSDEWSISGLPNYLTILQYTAERTTPGSSTTLRPELGYLPGWTTDADGHITRQSAAAAFVNDRSTLRIFLPDGILYGRSKPDAAADLVTTTIAYVPGWVL